MADIYNKCRLCLEESNHNFQILDETNQIAHQLSTCLSIEVKSDDLLPKIVCKNCARLLSEFYAFYVNSKDSEKLLQYYLTNLSDGNLSTGADGCGKNISLECSDINSNTFDLDLLTNNSNALSALECLESSTDIVNLTQKLLNNGVKMKRIPKSNNSNLADDSIEIHMEIDVLDSEMDIVNKLLQKDANDPVDEEKIPEKYSCLSCRTIFNDFDRLTMHLMKCTAVKRTFNNKFEIKDTPAKPRVSITYTYRCKICDELFTNKNAMLDHVKSHFSDFDEGVQSRNCIYRCKTCDSTFVHPSLLHAHIRKHTDDMKNMQYLCDVCGKDFKSYKGFVQHALNHGRNYYECGYCKKRFVDVTLLERHLIKHKNKID